MQYNKIRFAVGVFILSLFVVILGSFYLLLDEKGFLTQKYTYHFNINSAESFSVGMPLKFSGFNVGIIDTIALKNDGNVTISFIVDEKNRKWIREETYLTIKKPLIGSPYIVVNTQLQKALLEDGSVVKITQSDDINDMIERLNPVVKKIIKIIDNIDIITQNIARKDSDLFQMIQNLNTFSANLAKNDALLTTITGDKASTQSLIDMMNSLKVTMKNISKLSNSLDKDIIEPSSNTIKELESIMKDISKKLKTIDGTVESVGSYKNDLVEVKEQLSVTIEKSNEVLDKVDTLLTQDKVKEVQLP